MKAQDIREPDGSRDRDLLLVARDDELGRKLQDLELTKKENSNGAVAIEVSKAET